MIKKMNKDIKMKGQNGLIDNRVWIFIICVFFFSLFLSSPSHACSNPTGSTGDTMFNETHNVPQYCDGTNWIAMSGGDDYYVPNAVDLTGGHPYTSSSLLVLGASSQMVTISGWFKRTAFSVTDHVFFHSRLEILLFNPDRLVFYFRDPSDTSSTQNLQVVSSITLNDNHWHHFMLSVDISDPTKQHLYVDGVEDTGATWTINDTTETISFSTPSRIGIGGETNPGSQDDFHMADFWLDAGIYIDLSIEANRRKFRTAHGNPVYLGSNGARPTGSSPELFFSGDTANWHTNKGTTIGFIEDGTITDSDNTPYTPRTQTVPSGLIGHWRLDETSGTTALDSSGNGNDGTLLNGLDAGTDSVTGKINNGFDFTGADGYVEVSNTPLIGTDTTFTISAWIFNNTINNTAPLNQGPIYGEYTTTSTHTQNYLFVHSSGSIFFDQFLPIGGAFQSNTVLETGRWYHVVYVQNSTVEYMYINGVLDATDTTIEIYGGDPTDSVGIGYRERLVINEGSFEGIIDDVRLYNRAITSEEVAQIYAARDGIRYNSTVRIPEYFDGNKFIPMNAGFAEPTTDLVGHWKLDETTGTTAVDSSGNGNDATLISTSFDDYAIQGAVGGGLFLKDTDPSTTSGSERLDTPNLLDDTNDITASLWIKRNDASTNNIARIIVSNGGDDTLFIQSDTLRYVPTGAAAALVSAAIPKEVWVHVAVTYQTSNKEHKIYVNGSEEASNTDAGINFSTFLSDIALSSSGFDGGIDDIRLYNRILSATEITQLYQMGTPVGTVTALPQGCPNIGDVCDDGTIYAGLSPDGNVEMYTTVNDITGLSWNDGNTNYSTTGTTSTTAGENNTYTIVVTDSNSVAAGFQQHNAAQYCYDLIANGADDWYLPSGNSFGGSSELHTVINNGAASPNVNLASGRYWVSTENSASNARILDVNSSTGVIGGGNFSKHQTSSRTRCVRKGPAPRCANPYGLEGAVIYNTTHDVMQYCDGARWIGIGKAP